MGPEHVVLDISSDEEETALDGFGTDSFDYQSSFEWLSKMLELEDEASGSLDVVVVDELSVTAPVQKMNSAHSDMAKHIAADDSDDDCKVLDGNPDKPIEVIQNEGNESDDLLIVGEKGQLACRDFPHSRHLCATFPFGTTSHEKFCKLCHCYVCDIPAPCIHWGTGSSSDDHCHSSDKEEKWRRQRKALRHVNNVAECTESIPVATPSIRPPGTRLPSMRVRGVRTSCNSFPQTMSSSSMHVGPWLAPQTLIPMHIRSGSVPAQTSRSMPVGPASVPLQNSGPRLHTFRRCSATRFGPPAIISQRRNHQSGIVHSSHRYIPQINRSCNLSGTDSIEKDWCVLSPQTDRIQMDRCGLSPQVISAHTKDRMAVGGFINLTAKRPRTTGTIQPQVYSRKLQRNSCLPAPSVDENLKEWQDVLLGQCPDPETNFWECPIYPQPEVDIYPQPEVGGQAYTHTKANIGMNLLSSSAPATSNLTSLGDRLLDTASLNATSHVSVANSPMPNVQSVDLYAIPESNSVLGGVPLGERIGSLGQLGPQEAAGDQGLRELCPCTYDEQEILNSLLYV